MGEASDTLLLLVCPHFWFWNVLISCYQEQTVFGATNLSNEFHPYSGRIRVQTQKLLGNFQPLMGQPENQSICGAMLVSPAKFPEACGRKHASISRHRSA
ncbi:hypothetical protein BD289DRAFT_253183 [Coniella lustricola]|uniref:Uncharacterized protein n=1 Tax=Coniella lustricola TaxID=2025994 RepID=A0A2T3A8E3_9PEZI|nr:hypothetical protein BD289DRAFT_253183 [Coniella lustricola]